MQHRRQIDPFTAVTLPGSRCRQARPVCYPSRPIVPKLASCLGSYRDVDWLGCSSGMRCAAAELRRRMVALACSWAWARLRQASPSQRSHRNDNASAASRAAMPRPPHRAWRNAVCKSAHCSHARSPRSRGIGMMARAAPTQACQLAPSPRSAACSRKRHQVASPIAGAG